MAYTKKTWVSGETPLSAENMNHIEQGVADAHNDISSLNTKVEGYRYKSVGSITGLEKIINSSTLYQTTTIVLEGQLVGELTGGAMTVIGSGILSKASYGIADIIIFNAFMKEIYLIRYTIGTGIVSKAKIAGTPI